MTPIELNPVSSPMALGRMAGMSDSMIKDIMLEQSLDKNVKFAIASMESYVGTDLAKAYLAKQTKWTRTTFYTRVYNRQPGNTFPLVADMDDAVLAVKNFNNREMNNDMAALITGVRFAYGAEFNATIPADTKRVSPLNNTVLYSNTNTILDPNNNALQVPAPLQNAELQIGIGQTDRYMIPVKNLMLIGLAATPNDLSSIFKPLDTPIWWGPGRKLDASLEFGENAMPTTVPSYNVAAPGQTPDYEVATISHFYELAFDCVVLKQN